jgi:RNA-binding protein 39
MDDSHGKSIDTKNIAVGYNMSPKRKEPHDSLHNDQFRHSRHRQRHFDYRSKYHRQGPSSMSPHRQDSGSGDLDNISGINGGSSSNVLTEEQRDRRTVFVQQLAAKLQEKDLYDFMTRVGKVRQVRIVRDRVSGRSKGFGYVEYYEEQSVPLAILMSGEKLLGLPILISYTETEKNRRAEVEAANRHHRLYDAEYCQIQIKNVPGHIKEDRLRILLQPYGHLESVSMRKDTENTNVSQFTWVVQVVFKSHKNAKRAVEELHGSTLFGIPLFVSPMTLASLFPSKDPNCINSGDIESSLVLNSSHLIEEDLEGGGKGISLTSQARTELMMKLARNTDLVHKVPGIPQSTCIVISNAYDPDLETDPTWAKSLADDIKVECDKFGQISSLYVLKSKAGEVYIQYSTIDSAKSSLLLKGRWFGGRQLDVCMIPDATFRSRTAGMRSVISTL